MFNPKDHLKKLVEAHAPSGYEAPIADILREDWADLVDEFDSDKLGSLIGIKRATRTSDNPRKIMLAAHMDEIGMMVREIEDGFIFLHNIGGMDTRVMMAQPVLVHGKKQLPGVVATIPPHMLSAEERKKYPEFETLVVDVGLPAEEVNDLVRIGDLVTVDVPMVELLGRKVAGKAMDDRACVAIITTCLQQLQQMQHSWDVYATATVQEEVGLRGATTAAHHINPDVAIALDVGFAEQPGVNGGHVGKMGDGPLIGIGPNFHPKLYDKIRDVAKYYDIKLQTEAIAGRSGTDAWAIQVSRDGVPTALLSIALRNMHSPVETLDLKDIERAGRLLAQFIATLDDEFLGKIDLTAKEDEKSDDNNDTNGDT